MKTHRATLTKSFAVLAFAIVVFTLTEDVAGANEIVISGSTTGVVTGVPELTFAGSPSFFGVTSLGSGSLSGINNLGAFFLNASAAELRSGTFTLNITFESPFNINGGQSTTYTASILGSVAPDVNQGGMSIHFANPTQFFTFGTVDQPGSFSLTVADLFVQTGQSAFITAGFTGQQAPNIPEPATLLLLGTGLTGIAARLRKRRRESALSYAV